MLKLAHTNPAGVSDRDVPTLHKRLMVALASAGISTPLELVAAWNQRFAATDGKKLLRQTAHKWFSEDIKTMDPETLFRLADLTHYSARWIFRHEGPPGKWLPTDPDKQALLEIWDSLTPEDREAWVRVGSSMVASDKKIGSAVFSELANRRR